MSVRSLSPEASDPSGRLLCSLLSRRLMYDQDRNRLPAGQSPRTEYRSFHRNALKALGLDVEILERACLDGLTRAQIAQNEISRLNKGWEWAATSTTLLPTTAAWARGWEEIFVRQDWCLERAQAAIDAHEADGVDLILMCCAEMYPEGALHSKVPLVLPYQLMFDLVRRQAEARRARSSFALLLPTPWHIGQDRATWQSQPWMARRQIAFRHRHRDRRSDRAAQAAGTVRPRPRSWGYGDGLAPFDPDTLLADISAALGCPTVTPNVLNVFQARMLAAPAWPEQIPCRALRSMSEVAQPPVLEVRGITKALGGSEEFCAGSRSRSKKARCSPSSAPPGRARAPSALPQPADRPGRWGTALAGPGGRLGPTERRRAGAAKGTPSEPHPRAASAWCSRASTCSRT